LVLGRLVHLVKPGLLLALSSRGLMATIGEQTRDMDGREGVSVYQCRYAAA